MFSLQKKWQSIMWYFSTEYQWEIMIWRILVNDIRTAGGFGEVVWKGQDLRNWDYLRVSGGLGMARSEEQEILDEKNGGKEGRGWIFATSAGFGRERSSPSHLRWNFIWAQIYQQQSATWFKFGQLSGSLFFGPSFQNPKFTNWPESWNLDKPGVLRQI